MLIDLKTRYKISKLENELKELKELLERNEKGYPASPETVNGSIVVFSKQFYNGGKWYQYAALYINGTWYLTGRDNKQFYGWEDLMDFVTDSYSHTSVRFIMRPATVAEELL